MYTHTRDQQGPALPDLPGGYKPPTAHSFPSSSVTRPGCLLAGSSETNASIYPSALETGWSKGFLHQARKLQTRFEASFSPRSRRWIARRRPRGRLTPLTPLEVHLLQRLLYPGHRTRVRAAGAIRARLRRRHPGCRDRSQALLRNAHTSRLTTRCP